MKKAIGILMTVLLLISATAVLFACGAPAEESDPPGARPEVRAEVTEVVITYDGKPVTGGVLSLDLSLKNITLSADVKTKGDAEYELSFTGDEPTVAEVTADGLVTLKGVGEVVICAAAGDKKHEIVLVIGDDFAPQPQTYTVTVEGGTANMSSAKVGEQVSLTPAVSEYASEHKSFVKWEYLNAETREPIEDMWINGNVFRMPGENILVRAVLEDKLYTLNLIGGTVSSATDGTDPVPYEGENNGDTVVYRLPYDTQVTVTADEEEDGEMFVGWDYEMRKNRVGDPGQTEYQFSMPDRTLSVFGVFSETRHIVFGGNNVTDDRQKITDGRINNEGEPDPALEGMDGYRYNFAANKAADEEGYAAENLTSTQDFSTLSRGSQSVKVRIANRSDQTLKLEMYAVSYSSVATSGVIEVAPEATTEKIFIAAAGFHNPSFSLVLRESLTGSSSEKVTFDIVYEAADTYPDGDPQFRVAEAQYARIVSRTPAAADYPAGSGIRGDCYIGGSFDGGLDTSMGPTGVQFGGRRNTNNEYGITNIVTRDAYIKWDRGTPFLSAEFDNLPAYDPASPNVTVYFRVINTNNNKGTFDFGLGLLEDPDGDDSRVHREVVLEAGQTLLFGIEFTRTSDADLYFTIEKPINDSTGSATNSSGRYDHNIIIQMMYNNQIGVTDDNIVRAAG